MTQSSSVLFSLRELERMEEERVRALAEAAEREQVERERARRDQEQRDRLEQRAREQAEEDARREVERRAREEAARIEAIHRATSEAARLEVEAKARTAARDQELRHELERERARGAAGGSRARGALAATLFGAALAGGVSMAVHYGVLVPRERARITEAESALASRDVAIADLRANVGVTYTRLHTLEQDLSAARAENDQLRTDLEAARRPATTRHPAPLWTAAPPLTDGPRLDGFTSCAPGSKDPMCLR